jgi:hypothetical protein
LPRQFAGGIHRQERQILRLHISHEKGLAVGGHRQALAA